jgi:hypothetical protein
MVTPFHVEYQVPRKMHSVLSLTHLHKQLLQSSFVAGRTLFVATSRPHAVITQKPAARLINSKLWHMHSTSPVGQLVTLLAALTMQRPFYIVSTTKRCEEER